MTNENANLDIIDITLLLRQRRCRESVEDELRKQGVEKQYYCDVDIVDENGRHVLLPFIVNRNL